MGAQFKQLAPLFLHPNLSLNCMHFSNIHSVVSTLPSGPVPTKAILPQNEKAYPGPYLPFNDSA